MTHTLFSQLQVVVPKALVKTFGKPLLQVSLPSFSFIRCSIRKGLNIYFRKDCWVGDKPLNELFLHLYHLSSMKLHFVASILLSSDPFSSFYFGFLLPLYDREVIDGVVFLSLLHDQHTFQARRDSRF